MLGPQRQAGRDGGWGGATKPEPGSLEDWAGLRPREAQRPAEARFGDMGRFTAGTRGWFCRWGLRLPGLTCSASARPSACPPARPPSLCFSFFLLPSQYVAGGKGSRFAGQEVWLPGTGAWHRGPAQCHGIAGQGNKQLSVPSTWMTASQPHKLPTSHPTRAHLHETNVRTEA